MRIIEFLDRRAVEANLRASNKKGVLRELVGLLLRVHPDLDPNQIVETLVVRERLQSTGIGDGIAIPHGKTSSVPQIVACLGRSTSGVDFQSLDGLPTQIFFTLLVPESSHGLHLRALARVSRLLKEAHFRQALLEAPDADAMYDILATEDAKL